MDRKFGKRFNSRIRTAKNIGMDDAARGIAQGNPEKRACRINRGNITGVSCIINERSGGDNADDIAFNNTLGRGRVFGLFTDRHLAPGFHELGNIILRRMIRHSAHRDLACTIAPARCQDKVQKRCRILGILVEHLIKIT